MKKIINKIKNNKLIYVVVGILIGLVITAGGVYAATVISASSVSFSGSTSGLTSTNMQDALNEAYNNAKTKCPDGMVCSTPSPNYHYAFGSPTSSSTTDFKSVIESTGSPVFGQYSYKKSLLALCIYRESRLECFYGDNYSVESLHLKSVFGESNCEVEEADGYTTTYCDDYNNNYYFTSAASSDGSVTFRYYSYSSSSSYWCKLQNSLLNCFS